MTYQGMSQYEENVARALKAAGWDLLRTGWPDFLCFRKSPVDGNLELAAVEVKKGDELPRPSQIKMHSMLSLIGIHTYICRTDASQAISMVVGQPGFTCDRCHQRATRSAIETCFPAPVAPAPAPTLAQVLLHNESLRHRRRMRAI